VPWLYRDSLGHLTIGAGHLLIKTENAKIRENFRAPLANLLKYGHEFLRESQTVATDYGTFCAARTPSQPGPLEAQEPIISFVKQLTPGRQVDDTVPGPWGLELDTYKKAKDANPELELLIDEAWNMMNQLWTVGKFTGRSGLPYAEKSAADFFECHSTFRLTEQGMTSLLHDDITVKLGDLGKYVTS
jgi:hypothetical protein